MSLLDTELEEVTKELKELEKQSDNFRQSINHIKSRKIRLLQEKCKDNVGRCFKRVKTSRDGVTITTYCKVVNTDNIHYDSIGISFNEFQYPALWFEYPYDNSKLPFYEDNLFSGAWGKGRNLFADGKPEEISQEEYIEKFNKVNLEWISHINNI